MVDFSVLENRDVKLALGAMAFNTTLVIAAWFGRVYWMHGIEQVVNKLQASLCGQFSLFCSPPNSKRQDAMSDREICILTGN